MAARALHVLLHGDRCFQTRVRLRQIISLVNRWPVVRLNMFFLFKRIGIVMIVETAACFRRKCSYIPFSGIHLVSQYCLTVLCFDIGTSFDYRLIVIIDYIGQLYTIRVKVFTTNRSNLNYGSTASNVIHTLSACN